GDDHADHSGEDRAGGHGAGDPAGISRAEGLRGGDRETGGHADREAEQQEQQAAGRADGGEGVHAEVTADHGGVGELVQLLDDVAEEQRHGEEEDHAPGGATGEDDRHGKKSSFG